MSFLALHLQYWQNYRSQLQTAATKDEALKLAIGAAENLMKALKLSSNPDQKKQLKSQCAVIMDIADRIKTAKNWTPLISQQPEETKHEQIGQWAANVEMPAASTSVHDDLASQSSSSYRDLSSINLPIEQIPNASGQSSASSVFLARSGRANESKQPGKATTNASTSLHDLSDQQAPFSHKKVLSSIAKGEHATAIKTSLAPSPETLSLPVTPSLHLQQSLINGKAASQSPAVASYSQIHRLKEPVSSRKRSKKEDIILLKASIVNGFKCPPWDKNPSPSEFALQAGVGLFR